jgi:hypothetical protein
MLGQPEFDRFFLAATGFERFEYQRRLAGGDGGRAAESLLMDVPTGLGKTAAVVLEQRRSCSSSRACRAKMAPTIGLLFADADAGGANAKSGRNLAYGAA